ncbi:hypothetical protein GLIP_2469 [Aliiglaciecola lipolytica E3]|uniref:Glycosyltransferase 2-like domain-containing protein n=2 Tax=Aliiglaciecola TaxID=1406885 RepID=K6YUZ1_9ALTE|nr:hypothetical protein GLIP_2469 [Aliiglaciecola lipolytica E3]
MVKPIKISVIIPVYNCEAFINETLNSVINQTYPADEIIVINDGSTDGSLAAIERCNIENMIIIDKPNGGVSSARNEGILAATGDWIAFLDGDDVWHPQKLELFAQLAQKQEDISVIFSEFTAWGPNASGNFDDPLRKCPKYTEFILEPSLTGWVYHQQLLTNWVLTSTAMLKYSVIQQIGLFDQELTIAEDWDLFIRASRIAKFYKIKQTLTYYRVAPDSLTKTVKNKDFASDIVRSAINKYGMCSPDGKLPNLNQFKRRSFTRYFDYGLGAYKQGWYKKSVQSFWQALKCRPSALRTWLFLFRAILKSIFTSPKK